MTDHAQTTPCTAPQWLCTLTHLIIEQSEPVSIAGIDPSVAQLAFARQYPLLQSVDFVNGDAMALPFPHHAFDLAVTPVVIFFVSKLAKALAEMVRVVAPGWNNGRLCHGTWRMVASPIKS